MLGAGPETARPLLPKAEIITILVSFRSARFTNLKRFYPEHICHHYKGHFPILVSYNHFVELQQRVVVRMTYSLKHIILDTLEFIVTAG